MNMSLVRTSFPPVAVGGVGGSGTRVAAAMLERLGFHLGDDLNEAVDNLWFTLLFKYREVLALPDGAFDELYRVFAGAMTGEIRPAPETVARLADLTKMERAGLHDRDWLGLRLDSLVARLGDATAPPGWPRAWGWKEPNTHIVLDRLDRLVPGLRYIHVARNGLDMALSGNQNQLRLWGPLALGGAGATPRASLAYWRWAHERILEIGNRMGPRFYFLNYDDMCIDKNAAIERLLGFLGIETTPALIASLSALVDAPRSVGRHRQVPLDSFDPSDVRFVASLGFKIAPP